MNIIEGSEVAALKDNMNRNNGFIFTGSLAWGKLAAGDRLLKVMLIQAKRKKGDDGEWYDDKEDSIKIYANLWKNNYNEEAKADFTFIADNFKAIKGSLVSVVGVIETQEWEDKDGNTKSAPAFTIKSINFIKNKGEKFTNLQNLLEGNDASHSMSTDVEDDENLPF